MTLGPTFLGFITMFLRCFCFVSSYVKSLFHIFIIVPSFSILHYCYYTFPSHFTMLLLCLPLHFECCFCALFLCHIVFVMPSLCKFFFLSGTCSFVLILCLYFMLHVIVMFGPFVFVRALNTFFYKIYPCIFT